MLLDILVAPIQIFLDEFLEADQLIDISNLSRI